MTRFSLDLSCHGYMPMKPGVFVSLLCVSPDGMIRHAEYDGYRSCPYRFDLEDYIDRLVVNNIRWRVVAPPKSGLDGNNRIAVGVGIFDKAGSKSEMIWAGAFDRYVELKTGLTPIMAAQSIVRAIEKPLGTPFHASTFVSIGKERTTGSTKHRPYIQALSHAILATNNSGNYHVVMKKPDAATLPYSATRHFTPRRFYETHSEGRRVASALASRYQYMVAESLPVVFDSHSLELV